MKNNAIYILLLVSTITASLPAQNKTRLQQAISLLENYQDKASQALQNVIQCTQSNVPCNQEIKHALTINGLIGAALKTIELSRK